MDQHQDIKIQLQDGTGQDDDTNSIPVNVAATNAEVSQTLIHYEEMLNEKDDEISDITKFIRLNEKDLLGESQNTYHYGYNKLLLRKMEHLLSWLEGNMNMLREQMKITKREIDSLATRINNEFNQTAFTTYTYTLVNILLKTHKTVLEQYDKESKLCQRSQSQIKKLLVGKNRHFGSIEHATENFRNIDHDKETKWLEERQPGMQKLIGNLIKDIGKDIKTFWKHKAIDKWTTGDVVRWLIHLDLPDYEYCKILHVIENCECNGMDIISLKCMDDVGEAFGIVNDKKLCNQIFQQINKIQLTFKSNMDTEEKHIDDSQKEVGKGSDGSFHVNIFSQGKHLVLNEKVTKDEKIISIKQMYKNQAGVTATVDDIHFYSKLKVLPSNKTLKQVNIMDEKHLVTVKFGADGANPI